MSRNEKELDAVMARLQEKIRANHILLGEPLPAEGIQLFERKFRISLPAGFRRFLREIGSSCQWRKGGAPFVTSPLDCPHPERLAVPFPFEDAWVWEDEEELSHGMDETLNGVIELTDIGCAQSFCLVVTGKCRGEAWLFSDVGITPCCPRRDFIGWLEKWLDTRGDADYFEEYSY